MLNSLWNSIGNYFLKRESSGIKRNRSMVDLVHAKSIGILYPLFALPDYTDIELFVTSLQKDHKDVKALGYLQHKEMITRFLPKLSYDFFSHQDLNWYNKPVNAKVNDFIHTEFDLLIDLTMEDIFPLKFIAGLSRARCKVGRYKEENNRYYDLMIKVDGPLRLPELIGQIRHYLTIIQQHE